MRIPKRRREPLMRPDEVAVIFDVTPDTVAEWAKTGKIPSLRTPGGKYRFRTRDIEAMIADGRSEETPEGVEAVRS